MKTRRLNRKINRHPQVGRNHEYVGSWNIPNIFGTRDILHSETESAQDEDIRQN